MAFLDFSTFQTVEILKSLKDIKNKCDMSIFSENLHKRINLSASKCWGNHDSEERDCYGLLMTHSQDCRKEHVLVKAPFSMQL